MDNKLPNPPVPITSTHDFSSFDCGIPALNTYLQKYSILNHQSGAARTFVATQGQQIVGYDTLAYGSVSPIKVPARVSQGLGQYPIPILLLARLAVDKAEQGKGLGKGLVKDALVRALQASEIAGLQAVVVHAKDESAKAFYQQFGFEPSPLDELHLYLLMKDLKRALKSR